MNKVLHAPAPTGRGDYVCYAPGENSAPDWTAVTQDDGHTFARLHAMQRMANGFCRLIDFCDACSIASSSPRMSRRIARKQCKTQPPSPLIGHGSGVTFKGGAWRTGDRRRMTNARPYRSHRYCMPDTWHKSYARCQKCPYRGIQFDPSCKCTGTINAGQGGMV